MELPNTEYFLLGGGALGTLLGGLETSSDLAITDLEKRRIAQISRALKGGLTGIGVGAIVPLVNYLANK